MYFAIEEAMKAGVDIPVGCIIVYKEEIIARSYNEVEIRKDPTAHAEILCLQKACKFLNQRNLTGSTLICTLEPCRMCEEAIKLARIDRVIFGAFQDNYSEPTIDWIGGIMEDECSKLITKYFNRIRDNNK